MIKLKNVTKFFKTDEEKKYILKNVSFTIPDGVNVGILGRNGAGKSTLLRMLGGIEFPNSGQIVSNNSFSWPLGLAGGFQGSMTARQNVKFVCRIYGKNNKEIQKIIEFVEDFAEIGSYFNMPIKLYSSGMRSRVSFGLSLAFDFDYIIIDETLSVGDENFRKKAKEALFKKIEHSNVLLVSHSMGDLRKICQAGVVLEKGQLYYYENIDDAIKFYHEINKAQKPQANVIQSSSIYCSDGNVFDNITHAAQHYKVRPYGIIQAIEKNSGSHVYLKKVFYKDGQEQPKYKQWSSIIAQKTIICSDGIVFEDVDEAIDFYKDRMPNAKFSKENILQALQAEDNNFVQQLKVSFYYLEQFEKGRN